MRHLPRLQPSPFVIAGIVLLSLVLAGCAKKPERVEDVRPVRAIQLSAHSQQLLADYSGSVQPRITAQLAFRVAGKISARKVDVGSQVKAGQLLMQLNPEDLRLAQTQAEGSFRAAQANLALAESELKRYGELRKSNAVSQSMLETKTMAASAARGEFEQAEALLHTQANQAEYADLIATSSGVVTAIEAEVGQVVGAGVPVVQVAQLNELEVVVAVPENSVDIVTRATSVQIHLWAQPQEVISGKLRELSPLADPATRTFSARISLVNPSPKVTASVKMGMTANVQFVINTANAFIKIPLTALLQDKGVTSVWLVENGAVKLVPVQIGGANGNDVLIVSGLAVGQTLVTAGAHLLHPGQRVTILQESVPSEINAQTNPYISAHNLLKPAAANQPSPEQGYTNTTNTAASNTVTSKSAAAKAATEGAAQ